MFASVIIGAIPRMGKTFLLRLLLLICALDVRGELHPYDLKGTGDLAPLRPVAHRYRAGDDPEDIEYMVADFRALRTEMRRRTKVIRDIADKDPARCPENKVTPELASDPRLGLHPIAVARSTNARWRSSTPSTAAEMEAICTDLVKRGPALGIMLILATQRPDAKIDPDRHQRERRAADVPEGAWASSRTTWCSAPPVQGGHPRNACSPSTTWASSTSPARGCARGSSAASTSTGPAAKVIVARARVMREAAGRITGYALGEDGDDEVALDRRGRARWCSATDDKLWLETIAGRLRDSMPRCLRGHHARTPWEPARARSA